MVISAYIVLYKKGNTMKKRNTTKKKLLAMLVILACIITCMPSSVQSAFADSAGAEAETDASTAQAAENNITGGV